MTTAILSKFLPYGFLTMYRFTNGELWFFQQEPLFVPKDFVVIDLYASFYVSGKEVINDIQTFLLRLDAKGIYWLLYVPDNRLIRELFSDFKINYIPNPRHIIKFPAVCITNYKVKV